MLMKQKIALMVLAAFFVIAGSFAQGRTAGLTLSQKLVDLATQLDAKSVKKQPAKKMLQMQQGIEKQKGFRLAMTAHAKEAGKDLTKRKNRMAAPRRAAADIISEQPEGTLVNYTRSGDAYVSTLFGVYQTDYSDAVGSVVFADDNKVYFKNIVSQSPVDAWIVGTLKGSKITISLPQTVYCDFEGGYCLEVAKMSYDEKNGTFVRATNQTVTLNYNILSGKIAPSSTSSLSTGYDIIGLSYDDDMSWAGYGDWAFTYEKVKDALVKAPAGLTTEIYALTAEGYTGSLVNVGFVGNDVYVQGIDKNLPETWVKGTVNGDKVTFKGGQYVGADAVSGYHQYLMAATAEETYYELWDEYYTEYTLSDGDITFDYDATTKTLSNGSLFMLNAGKTDTNYLSVFDKAAMVKFVEVAATPATPVVELSEGGYTYYSYGYGWGSIYVDINCSDVDGNYILPEKISYKLWVRVNGEEMPLTLSWYDYMMQMEETMTEIPFEYEDGWDIGTYDAQKYFYYYVVGPEAYGVQTIYRGAGVERASEIAWAEVEEIGAEVQPAAATPAYPDATISDTDNKIGFGYYTGNEDVNVTTNNYKPETYDVAVKFDDPVLVGTLIESITFPLQEVEGVSNISVFLTSQLRVENGKNAADLVVKAVTPDEAGFVTVKLDKPYTIPEGGVYVGYSMTIDDASIEANATPVAVINEYNEGGYYLHTSDGILKWLDFGELAEVSAMVQITVAGSNVMSNAVSILSSESMFVKTGEAITLPVNIVNYGSKGVQSLDIVYSVNGKSDTQHIEADVEGFFGKQAAVEVSIPAIAERGTYEVELTVTKVNGEDNELQAETEMSVIALQSVPKHRALLEEYTGTWCGWCPRGYVGLEKLAELYPDDYVLVSYHNGDDMEIMDGYSFPSNVEGFPDAWIDRAIETDAFYGQNDGGKELGIADDLAERSRVFGQADIDVAAGLSEDGNSVEVVASVTFPYDVTEGTFALEYILTADGLSDEDWGQSNYYAGGTDGGCLQMFNEAESTVYGLVYNDVAVMMSEIGGIEGSLPATAASDQAVAHTYCFQLADAVNTSGDNVIQDKTRLKVVALLVNTMTGEVVNANKCAVSQNPVTGIASVGADFRQAETVFYDLTGRRVSAPVNGVYVKTLRMKNGVTRSQKMLVK